MIFDDIRSMDRYKLPFADDVKLFLTRKDLLGLTQPEIELRGRDLFVRIMSYIPKPVEQNKFETHRVYADIQVVLRGRELMQIAPSDALIPSTEYDKEKDYQFYTVTHSVSDLVVDQGRFTVFFPGEAHRPSCLVMPSDGEVFKLVFKVRV